MTDEEIIQKIKESEDKAIERALLLIPEVIGNLLANHIALREVNKKFYDDHKEFKGKESVVQAVVEKIEGKNPFRDYKDILNEAVPEIRKRISDLPKLDNSLVASRPNLTINGEL